MNDREAQAAGEMTKPARYSAAEWRSYAEGLSLASERLTALTRGALAALDAARPLDVAAELVELLEELDGLQEAALGLAADASKPGPKSRPKKYANALMALLPAHLPKSKGGRPRRVRIISDDELQKIVVFGRSELGMRFDVEAVRSFVEHVWSARSGNRKFGSRAAEVKALQRRLSELRKQNRSETDPNSSNE